MIPVSLLLVHSAKGSEWEEHKYIKKIDGDYYYPDSYKGGRHLDSDSKDSSEEDGRIATDADLDSATIDELARQVWKGTFGNGEVRRELLGANYQVIQDRVNELAGSNVGKVKLSDVKGSKTEKVGDTAINSIKKKANETKMSQVYSVYAEQEKRKKR